MLWEAAQYRRRFFDLDELPPQMSRIADLGDVNVVFVPHTPSRHHEYAPLIHLLPQQTLARFGLPLLRSGQWPFMADYAGIDEFLPTDFHARLGRAWAWTVWPHLVTGSGISSFSGDDPVRLLAHNLDFWIPPVTAMMQARLGENAEIDKGPLPAAITLEDGSVLDGAVPGHPRQGGQIWFGEDDARAAVAETVEASDQTGRLRAILDAVRSNRVIDDFSPAGHSTDPYIGQPSTGGEQRLVERTGILDSRYMPTILVRLLVVLGLSVLCGVGCSSVPRSSGDLDRRSGCSLVVAERTQDRAQVVMDMHASGCRDQNGQLLERAQAVDRVAHAVWQSLELPVDAVRVSVSAPGALPEGTPTTIARDDLTERFGRGPSGVVWPVRDRPDETIWVVLPLAYLAAGVAMLLLVRGLRRAGVVVVLLRR